MPKISEYDLEQFEENEDYQVTEKIKRKKKTIKEKNHPDKKDYRKD